MDGAPAVCGLGHVLAGVEKAAEFAVEACAGDDELHTYNNTHTQIRGMFITATSTHTHTVGGVIVPHKSLEWLCVSVQWFPR